MARRPDPNAPDPFGWKRATPEPTPPGRSIRSQSPGHGPPEDGLIHTDGPLAGLSVEFVRSARRQRTVSAHLEGNRLIVQVPAGLTAAEEFDWAEKLGSRVRENRRRKELNSNGELAERAAELNGRYFEGKLQLAEIRYVTNQGRRFGSCTPSTRTIRISDRVATMPPWVRDGVIVHELAHLVESNHSPKFWKLANRYPLMERARGYLLALGLEEGTVE